MKRALRSVWTAVNLARSAPAILAYGLSNAKESISRDITRWTELRLGKSADDRLWYHLHLLLLSFPEFRTLFYYRLAGGSPVVGRVIQPFYPRLRSLYLSTDLIGDGLVVYHGFSTIVHAESIGRDCNVAQQVTIGSTKRGRPTIGDNVQITAGAVVIGGIRVGDNTIIGANATVTKDVPSDCVVVGNPAYIVRRNGVKVREAL